MRITMFLNVGTEVAKNNRTLCNTSLKNVFTAKKISHIMQTHLYILIQIAEKIQLRSAPTVEINIAQKPCRAASPLSLVEYFEGINPKSRKWRFQSSSQRSPVRLGVYLLRLPGIFRHHRWRSFRRSERTHVCFCTKYFIRHSRCRYDRERKKLQAVSVPAATDSQLQRQLQLRSWKSMNPSPAGQATKILS